MRGQVAFQVRLAAVGRGQALDAGVSRRVAMRSGRPALRVAGAASGAASARRTARPQAARTRSTTACSTSRAAVRPAARARSAAACARGAAVCSAACARGAAISRVSAGSHCAAVRSAASRAVSAGATRHSTGIASVPGCSRAVRAAAPTSAGVRRLATGSRARQIVRGRATTERRSACEQCQQHDAAKRSSHRAIFSG